MMMKNKTLIAVIVVSIFGIALIGCLRENLNSGNIDQGNFPNIKVAIVYESDGDPNDRIRDANSIANLVAETKADFIHRAYFRGRVMAVYEKKYEVYGILEDSIETIIMKNPNVLIGGAIAAHEINRVEYDPLTREVIPESKTWGKWLLTRKNMDLI